jgi:tetratricopeptide (TPR) repeat protein
MQEASPSPWWQKDASVFAALILVAALAFTATYFFSKAYGRKQDSLARRSLQTADLHLRAGETAKAVSDYRTALLYSHDNPVYRLRLARALAANGETSQAIAYFLNLLDEQPGNGLYNLELARLYSRQGNARKAALYYNGAIYGAWEDDPATARRGARTEFIRFLLSQNSRTQAQAEAMILAAGVQPTDVPARMLAARILLDTGEYDRAMDEYVALMKNDPVTAAMGAGRAAFDAGKFQSAARFLAQAVSHDTNELEAQSLLQKAKAVIDADPNRRRISSSERARRVAEAYRIAGNRLISCAESKKLPLNILSPNNPIQSLYNEWGVDESDSDPRKLAGDPDLRDTVMDLVARIEQTTAQQCGQPTGPDWALLMLARYGEGVEH